MFCKECRTAWLILFQTNQMDRLSIGQPVRIEFYFAAICFSPQLRI